MNTLVRAKPDIRVRKLMGDWCVQKLVQIGEHQVWSLVAAYTSWHIAFAVAQVEASPNEWPFYIRDLDHHIEECS